MFSFLCLSLTVAALLGSRSALAWGNLGHETVGYVAMSFLGPKALSFVQSSISDSDDNSLGPAATWADEVRSEATFKFTAPFHFVDAEDDPLGNSCSVDQSRDCGSGGCILTAIANYTKRVSDTTLSATQRQEALKFVTHFIGDIGQPLHVEALEVGGNDIDAICNGKSTNLHAAWDTGIPETYLDANFSGSSKKWATALVTKIKSGTFASSAASWISCSSTTKTVTRRSALSEALAPEMAGVRPLKEDMMKVISERAAKPPTLPQLACPLLWAQEANKFDCSTVFEFTGKPDLCTGTYFNAALPVIEMQIAKQGFRLAAWLNVIFDGSTLLP